MCGQALKMIGELASTSEQIQTVHRLIATWRYLFVDNIRDTPRTEVMLKINLHIPHLEVVKVGPLPQT